MNNLTLTDKLGAAKVLIYRSFTNRQIVDLTGLHRQQINTLRDAMADQLNNTGTDTYELAGHPQR
jgi:hypothetical protein